MSGIFVDNGDRTWTRHDEDYVLLPFELIICSEDDPDRDFKLSKAFGTRIEIRETGKDGVTSVSREHSF